MQGKSEDSEYIHSSSCMPHHFGFHNNLLHVIIVSFSREVGRDSQYRGTVAVHRDHKCSSCS